jgi:deoxyribodipyrimidine photolyase-related protein
MVFVILPNQLFDKMYLLDGYKYIIYEHPHYFESYNYNKKKLILHRASMKCYFDYLKSNKFNVKYVEFNKKLDVNNYKLFDPVDKIELLNKYEIINSPNFLLDDGLLDKYRKKTDKFFFNAFYMWSKKELDIIPKVKSQDKKNRKVFPKNKNIKIPNLLDLKNKNNKYVREAIKYVNKNFPNNCGNVDNFIYPIGHVEIKKWLKDFIKNRLNKFGDYQDYMKKDENYLFHSILSSSINIGLINPIDIINELLKIKNVPLNSLEGFIRQLFWREYQRYCYKYYNFNNKNYFGNKKKLNNQWYNGTTKIDPIDDCIIKAFDTGYLHHIERLMVIGNYMNLSGISPKEGFKWFMEFSIDSYEWVMHQNVYDMVFFVSGGATMRRPYASSSNYIIKMSDYKKGEWSEEWDQKYYDFIKKNKKKLYKYRYYFPSLKKLI